MQSSPYELTPVQKWYFEKSGKIFPMAPSTTKYNHIKHEPPYERPKTSMSIMSKTRSGVLKVTVSSCHGCGSNVWKRLVNFGESVVKTATAIIEISSGDKSRDDTVESRRHICLYCKLVQEPMASIYSCGIPFPEKPLRDPNIDGCGCFLNLKWRAKHERCPLPEPLWGPEEEQPDVKLQDVQRETG